MIGIYPYIKKALDGVNRPIIFEFGTFNGKDTRRLYDMFRDAAIYSWEINPVNLEFLKKQGWPNNIEIIPYAISNKDGQAKLWLSTVNNQDDVISAQSSLLEPVNHPARPVSVKFKKPIQVRTRSLDSFCSERGINHIDFIWADIQGAEPLMIEGAKKILSKTKYLYMELMPEKRYKGMLTQAQEVLDLLPESWELVHRYPVDILLKNRV